jgi:hypothetical protein
MKSVNRKVLKALVGVVLATPFLVTASVVGVHVASIADNVRVDTLCVALALVSMAAKIADEHLALRGSNERAEHGYVEPKGNTDLQRESSIRLSC